MKNKDKNFREKILENFNNKIFNNKINMKRDTI